MGKARKAIIAILFIILIFFFIDLSRSKRGKPPIFAVETVQYKDGGTREFIGAGYKVIGWNKLGIIDSGLYIRHGIYRGYEISFLPILQNASEGPGRNVAFVVIDSTLK